MNPNNSPLLRLSWLNELNLPRILEIYNGIMNTGWQQPPRSNDLQLRLVVESNARYILIVWYLWCENSNGRLSRSNYCTSSNSPQKHIGKCCTKICEKWKCHGRNDYQCCRVFAADKCSDACKQSSAADWANREKCWYPGDLLVGQRTRCQRCIRCHQYWYHRSHPAIGNSRSKV